MTNTTEIKIFNNSTSLHLVAIDMTIWYLELVLNGGVLCAISLFGISTNIINIVVFRKMGFKESSNITFLSLSISDLGQGVGAFATGVCNWVSTFWPDLYVDAAAIRGAYTFSVRSMFADISVLTTVLLSVERCLCVTMPFRFKDFMTRKKTLLALVAIYLVIAVCYVPSFYYARLQLKWDPFFNTTRHLFHIVEGYHEMQEFVGMFNVLFLTSASLVIMIISTLVLVRGLRKAAKFKKSSVATEENSLSQQNRNISNMVVFISVIFVACNVPILVTVYCFFFVPAIGHGKSLEFVFYLMFATSMVSAGLNASVNIFVYYRVSSRYRQAFTSLWSRQNSADKQTQK